MKNILNRLLNYELLILLAATILIGVFFSFSTPIGYGNDEMVHAYKAEALSTGQFFPKKIKTATSEDSTTINIYGGSVPLSLVTLATETSQAKVEAICTNITCKKPSGISEKELNEALNRSIDEDSAAVNFWGANSYTFIAYIPSSLGFSVAHLLDTSVGNAIYLARLANLAACSFIALFAFLLLAKSRFRWVIFSIILLPANLLSYSLLGVDGILNALSLVLMSIVALAVLKQGRDRPRYITYIAIAIAIVLPLIKLPYLLLSLLVLLPGVLHIRKNRTLVLYVLIPLMIVLPALTWNFFVSDATHTSGVLVHAEGTQPNPNKQLQHVIVDPLSFTEVFFKTVASRGVMPSTDNLTHQSGLKLPIDLTIISMIPIVVAILYASVDFRRNKYANLIASAAIVSSILVVCGIFAALYLGFNPVDNKYIAGVQSRYFIPIYGFVALGLSILLRIKISTVLYREKIAYLCLAIGIPVITAIWYINIVY